MRMATRMNISIPDRLKSRMTSVTQPVNWSAVATQAFSGYLDQLSAKPGGCPAPPKEVLEIIVAAGEHSGRLWAQRLSTPQELRRLAEIRRPEGTWDLGRDGGFTAGEEFFFVIEPESHGRSDLAVDFWGLFLAPGVMPHPAFVHAFANEAMKVWEDAQKGAMLTHSAQSGPVRSEAYSH